MMYGDILSEHRNNCPIKDCQYVPKPYRTLEDQKFDNVMHKIPFFSEVEPVSFEHCINLFDDFVERRARGYNRPKRPLLDLFSNTSSDSEKERKKNSNEKLPVKHSVRRKNHSKNSESKGPLKEIAISKNLNKKRKSDRPKGILKDSSDSDNELIHYPQRKTYKRKQIIDAPFEGVSRSVNTDIELSSSHQTTTNSPGKRTKVEEDLSFIDMEKYQENYNALENGYRCNQVDLWDMSVATLVNMGNTCYLNSVLYSLRFVPSFMHNLHHLLVDLNFVATKFKEAKNKTSSLGRNGNNVNGASWRSASSKDLLSIGNDTIPKSKKQIVTEKLHSLYVTMHDAETNDSPDAYQPKAVLQAIIEANHIFEGNVQQDAHELLGSLISCIRVTIDELNEQIKRNQIKEPEYQTNSSNTKLWSWKKSMRKKKNKDTQSANIIPTQPVLLEQENSLESGNSIFYEEDSENSSTNGECDSSPSSRKLGYNFITEDMEGMAILQTTCLECESVSERKEPFLEIQVPVPVIRSVSDDEPPNTPRISHECTFEELCVSSEKLCEQNKYFCEECVRYSEARREVLYEKLPKILIFQLKRFTSTMEKVNAFVPTPLEFKCFCVGCTRRDKKDESTDHRYKLCCVIMHLGADMGSGHYITYSRATCPKFDYLNCSRDTPKASTAKDSMSFLKFLKPKVLPQTTQNGIGNKKNDIQICQSFSCCGVRCKPVHDVDEWLEFDDNNFRLLSSIQFTDILNRPQGSSTNTPYLLFYTKVQ